MGSSMSKKKFLLTVGCVVSLLLVATSATAANHYGWVSDSDNFTQQAWLPTAPPIPVRKEVCKLTINVFVGWNGKKVWEEGKLVIHPNCHDNGGWKFLVTDYERRRKNHGLYYRIQGVFVNSGCHVRDTREVKLRFVREPFDFTGASKREIEQSCTEFHYVGPAFDVYRDGSVGRGKVKISSSDSEPAAICNDGVENQSWEECDQSGCDVGRYCTSACTCQPVSPFASGTFTRTPNGAVYRTAGQSPVYLSTCARSGYFPGCPAAFWNAPQDFVDALLVLYPVPVDGSLVRRPDGAVFQMRNGRAQYVRACADVGGCNGLVDLDWAAIDRLGGQVPGDRPVGHGLASGQHLFPGEYLDSPDGTVTLKHQTDGNVVLYRDGAALWSTVTYGGATARLTMQEDGNLVLYALDGTPLWHTFSWGHPGATLRLQNDCNVVVYDPNVQPLWNAGTWRACGTCWIECCNPHGHFVTLNGPSRQLCAGVSACSGPWGGVRNRLFLPNYTSGPVESLFHNPNC